MARRKASKARPSAKPAADIGVKSSTRHAQSPSPTIEQLSDAELAASIAMDKARVNAISGTLASESELRRKYGVPNSGWTAKATFQALVVLVFIGIVATVIGGVGWTVYKVASSARGHHQAEAERRTVKAQAAASAMETVPSVSASASDGADILSRLSGLSKAETVKILREQLVKLEADRNVESSRASAALTKANDAGAHIEYNSIVAQGTAGQKELLILAKKKIENPTYESDLMAQQTGSRREYDRATEQIKRLNQLIVEYGRALRTTDASGRPAPG